ncbi:ABC transporter ATP-binding protein [Actinosynnema sp. ALI-1.44]|uniref:ABC transporter ATP-binding protein n=1 Tax=Actinosynnema sp. ALI-1.44 TaxID=1933779 RepID=UPI00097C5C03|nr:ABC transporter ATP-binding protein [Actinosynnema sp. ALI-1.44]ONI74741.1 ABC transporter ATP-binding protein [Actinosynnema sp. ALI-1.44]
MTEPILAGRSVVKRYGDVTALAGVDITIGTGEVVAIVGPSGSGKSTLLHVLAGILPADGGEVFVGREPITRMSETERSKLRRTEFGFVFQSGMLVAELTAEENVALPMLLAGTPRDKGIAAAREWLVRLGLGGLSTRRPGEVSGGQMQRMAIARALAHSPRVIFADEPTGALDTRTGQETISALLTAARETNAAVVIVTHDESVANRAQRIIEMRDGLIAVRAAA